MAYQIIKSGSAGRWIKQPNRLVKTFPSGLCMIQQDYIADRNFISYEDFREGDILSQEDSSPCIDNAYIFPAPSYQDLGNGFVKCTVTAYGRTTQQATTVYSKRAAVVDFYRPEASYIQSSVTPQRILVGVYALPKSTNVIRDVAIFSSVIRKDDILRLSFPVLKIYEPKGEAIFMPASSSATFEAGASGDDPIFETYTATTSLEPFLESFSQIEYGEFIELVYAITVRTVGTLRLDDTAE